MMKVYLAGRYTSHAHRTGQLYSRLNQVEREHLDGAEYLLESYYYIRSQIKVDRIREDKIQVFLDSGAFSAYTQGIKVDIKAYCDYIKRNKDIIIVDDGCLCASVLDSVGDPMQTWQNQQTMERLGVRPLPCFHFGEDPRWVEWYVANYDYITIGGMVPISTPQLRRWLDRIWEKHLTDGSGRAKIKVHGFGLTTPELMQRYPWHSVDSTAWIMAASNGTIMFPQIGKYVSISRRSPSIKVDGRHLDTLPDIQKQALLDLIHERGFEADRLRDCYEKRWAWNAWAFAEFGRHHNTTTFKRQQMELF